MKRLMILLAVLGLCGQAIGQGRLRRVEDRSYLGQQVANYPAYSPTATATVKYGLTMADTEGSSYTSAGSQASGWVIHIDPLNLGAGTYTITNWKFRTYRTGAADCADCVLVIYSKASSTYTLEWSYNCFADISLTDSIAQTEQDITPSPGVVQISATKTYYAGVAIRRTAGATASRPGLWRMKTGEGPLLSVLWQNANIVGDLPSEIVATGELAVTSAVWPCLLQQITMTTTTRKIAALPAYTGTAIDRQLPLLTSDYCIILRDVTGANGEDLTVELCDHDTGVESSKTTFKFDLGDTDQVTFGPTGGTASVALRGSDEGDHTDGEVGDKFDVVINLRPTANTADCLYCNKTWGAGANSSATDSGSYRDLAWFGHHAKAAGGARHDGGYASTVEPTFLKITGSADCGSIEVAYQPIVLLGDSQIGIKTNATSAATVIRIGAYLPTAFTYDRYAINAGIVSNSLTEDLANSSTAAYLRYNHTTAGLGDLCELTGVLVCPVIGLNDIVINIASDETVANKRLGIMAQRMSEIVYDALNQGNQVFIVGLPPYFHSTASATEQQAVRSWNYFLHGLALGVRAPYYCPYSLVNASRLTYMDSGGINYLTTEAGVGPVANAAAAAFEAGYVPERLMQR